MHETDVIDDYGTAEERAAARLLDTDNSWQDVPAEWLEKFGSALAFMDPLGFRYYIPAFMVWAASNYKSSRAWSIDTTIYALEPTNDSTVRAQRTREYELLSPKQCEAVALFLLFMSHDSVFGHADSTVARRALETYWARYVPASGG